MAEYVQTLAGTEIYGNESVCCLQRGGGGGGGGGKVVSDGLLLSALALALPTAETIKAGVFR